MAKKTILMACSNYWTSPFHVGSHNLAKGFIEEGWNVAFVSDPISPFHILDGKNTNLRERFALYKSGGKKFLDGHLWTYVPGALLTPNNKPLLRTRFVLQNWEHLTLPNVIRQIKKSGFGSVDLLYIDSTAQRFWIEALQYKKSIFRIADNISGFEKATSEIQAVERMIAASVDLTVYTARELRKRVEALHPKDMLYLSNGVDFKHFDNGLQTKPKEYYAISGPIAIYVGAMDYWFDFDLITYAAKKLPEVAFVLIGPSQNAKARTEPLKNIYFLGSRDYNEIPSYLLNSDVGIIPFNKKKYPELVNNVNPLKLYEYLACGLPVVSVDWDELNNLQSPAILCQDADEFVQGIREAISKPKKKDMYTQYASQHDWSFRIKQLIARLFKSGNP